MKFSQFTTDPYIKTESLCSIRWYYTNHITHFIIILTFHETLEEFIPRSLPWWQACITWFLWIVTRIRWQMPQGIGKGKNSFTVTLIPDTVYYHVSQRFGGSGQYFQGNKLESYTHTHTREREREREIMWRTTIQSAKIPGLKLCKLHVISCNCPTEWYLQSVFAQSHCIYTFV